MEKLLSYWNTPILSVFLPQIMQAANAIEAYWDQYLKVGKATGLPAYVVGVIHFRESSFNFARHLANGDPLFNSDGNPMKTSHVPQGLGPYPTWSEGAIGAIKHQGFDNKTYHWDLLNALDNLERFNGLGFRYRGIASPYVWSGTSAYTRGMYVADNMFDPNKIDPRPGCAPILKELQNRGYELDLISPKGVP